jgi:hypothetical protein
MGLDQFAFAIDNNGEKRELAYWRKHPNLQGWMERLWENKGRPMWNEDMKPCVSPSVYNKHGDTLGEFNCIPLELTKEDLVRLEYDITYREMPITTGFFFGSDSDDYYRKQDLEFCRKANEALDNGLTVVYDSWW